MHAIPTPIAQLHSTECNTHNTPCSTLLDSTLVFQQHQANSKAPNVFPRVTSDDAPDHSSQNKKADPTRLLLRPHWLFKRL